MTYKRTDGRKLDEMRKPEIKLNPLEKIVVNPSTEEEHNELMRVYECGGWGAELMGLLATYTCGWKNYGEKTCSKAQDKFSSDSIDWFSSQNYKIISPQEFYDKQKITQEQIKEINKYFKS